MNVLELLALKEYCEEKLSLLKTEKFTGSKNETINDGIGYYESKIAIIERYIMERLDELA